MISGIIMASGFSRRMKQEKLTLEINGLPMIERVIQIAKNSRLEEIILVYRNLEIKEIGEAHQLKNIFNPEAHLGQSRAMKLGIEATNPNTQGYMFFMADQPLLKVEFVNHLIGEFEEGTSPIVVPLYRGKRGNPTIFSSQLRDRLLVIEGDEGGRDLIREISEKVLFVESDEALMGQDVDTWETYHQILGNSKD